jgi:hypothetical protein
MDTLVPMAKKSAIEARSRRAGRTVVRRKRKRADHRNRPRTPIAGSDQRLIETPQRAIKGTKCRVRRAPSSLGWTSSHHSASTWNA